MAGLFFEDTNLEMKYYQDSQLNDVSSKRERGHNITCE